MLVVDCLLMLGKTPLNSGNFLYTLTDIDFTLPELNDICISCLGMLMFYRISNALSAKKGRRFQIVR